MKFDGVLSPGKMMTMVDPGHHGFLMVFHVSSWSTFKYNDKVIVRTMVDHGSPLPKWMTIVKHVWTMVDHGQIL